MQRKILKTVKCPRLGKRVNVEKVCSVCGYMKYEIHNEHSYIVCSYGKRG